MRLVHPAVIVPISLLLSLSSARLAGAQRASAPVPAGPGTIVGVVTDSTSRPLDNVEVRIGRLNRSARTGANGTFRFDSVPAGKHDLRARRVGYAAQSRSVNVREQGGTVAFSLEIIPQMLPTVITSMPRGGLGGVVTDAKLVGLPGAGVRVFGGAERTVTDSLGEFFMDVRPGSYMVRVTMAGHAPRLLSVTIPPDSGRRIRVALHAGQRGSNMKEIEIQNLARRLTWRVSPSWFYSREQLDAMGTRQLRSVVQRINPTPEPLEDTCVVLVNGGPETRPLWYFDADEIDGLEVYTRNSLRLATGEDRNAAIKRNGGGEGVSGSRNCPLVYVWLRDSPPPR